ncbi:hypothetical protein P4V95_19505 [Bacillus thuringiensis]|nr:hypothetical protein [Bacillus thuringiensis]
MLEACARWRLLRPEFENILRSFRRSVVARMRGWLGAVVFVFGVSACLRCVLTSQIRRAERFKTNVSFFSFAFIRRNKRTTIQFDSINKSFANECEELNEETTLNPLRFNYNSQTNNFTNLIATKNKQRFSMIQFTIETTNKLQNKKKDHKEKSNNKLIEYTYENTYSSR